MFRAPSIDAHPYIELSSPTVLSTFSPSRLNNDSNRARDRPPPSPVVSVASRLGSPLCGEFCFTHLRVIGDPDRRDVAFHLGPLVRGHVFQSLNHCARASRSRFNRRRQSIAFASLSIHRIRIRIPNPSVVIHPIRDDDYDDDDARGTLGSDPYPWSRRVAPRRRSTPRWVRTLGSFCSRVRARFSPTSYVTDTQTDEQSGRATVERSGRRRGRRSIFMDGVAVVYWR